jgi:hypothetical protein
LPSAEDFFFSSNYQDVERRREGNKGEATREKPQGRSHKGKATLMEIGIL